MLGCCNFDSLALLSLPEVSFSGYHCRICGSDVMTLIDLMFPNSREGALIFMRSLSLEISDLLVLPM